MIKTKFGSGKFDNRETTQNGSQRAYIYFKGLKTLCLNTGTFCNISCQNCYIKSSPLNDSLIYLEQKDVNKFLQEIKNERYDTKEIGFTGGEPFMNPELIPMTRTCLQQGYQVLILTNAMKPMMRPHVQQGLFDLNNSFGDNLKLRISLDHWSSVVHDKERGKGSYELTLKGIGWLSKNGFNITIAGRALTVEKEEDVRKEYAKVFAKQHLKIDAFNKSETLIFPEMDENLDVPEITTECWRILNKEPDKMMCSSSRMIIKRKGNTKPKVIACTLLPYQQEFEIGETLRNSSQKVFLNHHHCAQFCVLSKASCSD